MNELEYKLDKIIESVVDVRFLSGYGIYHDDEDIQGEFYQDLLKTTGKIIDEVRRLKETLPFNEECPEYPESEEDDMDEFDEEEYDPEFNYTTCIKCKKDLTVEEIGKIITNTLGEQLKQYDFICDECLNKYMSTYGGNDEICISGADDFYVSYRHAYHRMGM